MSMIHSFGCKQDSWQVCLACKAQVCACRGLARGQCPECYRGLLTNYYSIPPRPCGYKGCKAPAVAATPRVKFACMEHAIVRGGYKPPAIQVEPAAGVPTAHTQRVLKALNSENQP